jgi:hypothetical protein
MSKRKKSKKNGSGDEEEDPKHPNNDPRTKVTQKQTEKIKKLAGESKRFDARLQSKRFEKPEKTRARIGEKGGRGAKGARAQGAPE